MDVFPNVIMKPKSHFLQHYPAMIRTFGPLIKTLRFESKNTYFKSTFQSSKDRKNVCYSVAERHQMLMYIHFVKSSLLEVTLEVLESLIHKAIEDAFKFEEGETLCQPKAIVREGNRYGTGECVVLSGEDDEPLFGYVSFIFHYKRKAYLLCDLLVVSEFNTHFNCYQTEKSGYLEIFDLDKVYDYRHLGVYYVASKMLINLRYYLTFS